MAKLICFLPLNNDSRPDAVLRAASQAYRRVDSVVIRSAVLDEVKMLLTCSIQRKVQSVRGLVRVWTMETNDPEQFSHGDHPF